jgi:glycosyltransferase involved in cell wall biosynthesis
MKTETIPPDMRLGYIIPEFPGQTHVWIWREINHLREFGVPIHLFSTRRPSSRDRARHAFADSALAETNYLWPLGVLQVVGYFLWAAVVHPLGLLRCLGVGLSLPVRPGPAWLRVLPLVVPACKMAWIARRLRITHFHNHSCSSCAILCMMVKRLVGIPFSMTLNANIEWWGGAMREKFQDAAFTIAITQWLLDQMKRDHPGLAPRQRLLGRIGVDTRKWRPAAAAQRAANHPPRLITVGRLHQSKGHDVLIRAVRALLDRGVEVRLHVIGDGPERQNLETQAAQSGCAGHISFLGSLSEEEIIAHLKDADVFVLASHAEPLGVVYMEAMAMQVATIGTAAGGVGEIISSGVDGILVPPGDPVALANSIQYLLEDRAFRERIAAAGRRTIVERFDSRFGAMTLLARITGRDQSPEELSQLEKAVENPIARHRAKSNGAPKPEGILNGTQGEP